MIKFEDPLQFIEKKKNGNTVVEYSNLMEISQGGPVVGKMTINGTVIRGRFGGPFLIEKDYIYAPLQVKRFFGTGFKLVRINNSSLDIETLGKTLFFIQLDKVENNRVYFFEDINKSKHSYYELK